MLAEFGGEGLDLGASGIEGAGTVDGVGGVAKFFVEGKLGGDAVAGFEFAHAAGEEALELLLGSAEGNDESIEISCEAGFDEKGGFDEGGIAEPGSLPRVELKKHGLLDARMKNGVEASELVRIAEDDGGEFATINAAGALGEIGAEFAKDFVVSRLAALHQFVGDGIGVEDGEAEFAKHGGNGALAAGDAAGEAEFKHGDRIQA